MGDLGRLMEWMIDLDDHRWQKIVISLLTGA
jgi:hypothetical protein